MTANPAADAEAMVEDYLAERFQAAGDLPGLRAAVEARLAARIDDISDRDGAQIQHLKARGLNRPKVYYAHEEALEHELQAAAAGIRAAMAMEGLMADANPVRKSRSERLASRLAGYPQRSIPGSAPANPARRVGLVATTNPVGRGRRPRLAAAGSCHSRKHRRTRTAQQRPRPLRRSPVRRLGPTRLHRTATHLRLEVSRAAEPGASPSPWASRCRTANRRIRTCLSAGQKPEIWTYPHNLLAPELDSAQAQANLAALARPLTCLLAFEDAPRVPTPNADPGSIRSSWPEHRTGGAARPTPGDSIHPHDLVR